MFGIFKYCYDVIKRQNTEGKITNGQSREIDNI